MAAKKSLFEQDLERDLENPEFHAAFLRESAKIETIDRIVNALDEARLAQGLTKAELARAIGSNPSSIRRLFSAQGNPTLATLSDLASVLGMKITLTALPRTEAESLAGTSVGSKAPSASPAARSRKKTGKPAGRAKGRAKVPA